MRTDRSADDWRAPGTSAGGSPVVSRALEQLDLVLGDLNELSLTGLPDADVTRLLDTLTAAAGRLRCATGSVAVEVDRRRLPEEAGARNTPVWWAHRSRLTRGGAGRILGHAKRLATTLHAPVRHALASGRLGTDQAEVIVDAVDALPDRVDATVRGLARDHLLAAADEHDARALRILGRRILDVIAPDIAEAEEQRQLEAEEARAAAKARITLHDDGHGQCHGRFTLPSFHGALLRAQLHALANPRRHPSEPGAESGPDSGSEGMPDPVITPERLGQAFMSYIESYPADRVPGHGGASFSFTVTIDLDTLLSGIGAATLATGGRISAGEARRLACRAGLVPAVLDGGSQPLDLGRSQRLFSPAQRRALDTRDRGCTAQGCGLPPAVCDAHHDQPWSAGGPTDLTNGRLLCPHHHRLAHHPRYDVLRHPGNTITFHRRT